MPFVRFLIGMMVYVVFMAASLIWTLHSPFLVGPVPAVGALGWALIVILFEHVNKMSGELASATRLAESMKKEQEKRTEKYEKDRQDFADFLSFFSPRDEIPQFLNERTWEEARQLAQECSRVNREGLAEIESASVKARVLEEVEVFLSAAKAPLGKLESEYRKMRHAAFQIKALLKDGGLDVSKMEDLPSSWRQALLHTEGALPEVVQSAN